MPVDTIAAIATPAGRGGIGVLRVSGAAARAIAAGMCSGVPAPRLARLATFRSADGGELDRGLALFFPAPHSFTGEDVLELHAHGSPVVLDLLLRRACELGARPARAGEFSERAFLNGKLDLAQAEAVADLIAARSETQARAALRSLDGEFSRRVSGLAAAVTRLRVQVEASIDFADDAPDSGAAARLANLSADAAGALAALLASARRGARLSTGLHGVIAGAPNVGKSSLLNALAGSERAIVTAVPGTTRDVLRESVQIDGVELALADTAGLRESDDPVEREGVRRAHAELDRADLVLWVVDDPARLPTAAELAALPPTATRIVVINKVDLTGRPPVRGVRGGALTVALSARTGAGLDLLRSALREAALGGATADTFSARTRHVLALERAGVALAKARAGFAAATPELVAEDLRSAQQALGEITGTFSTEDLLGAIFSTFCVGK